MCVFIAARGSSDDLDDDEEEEVPPRGTGRSSTGICASNSASAETDA
jgi:hypothetical protein